MLPESHVRRSKLKEPQFGTQGKFYCVDLIESERLNIQEKENSKLGSKALSKS